MAEDTKNTRQCCKGHHYGIKKKENNTETRNRHTRQSDTKRNNRFKRFLPRNIINLSIYTLDKGEISLISKGLNFTPTPKKEHPGKIIQDFSIV